MSSSYEVGFTLPLSLLLVWISIRPNSTANDGPRGYAKALSRSQMRYYCPRNYANWNGNAKLPQRRLDTDFCRWMWCMKSAVEAKMSEYSSQIMLKCFQNSVTKLSLSVKTFSCKCVSELKTFVLSFYHFPLCIRSVPSDLLVGSLSPFQDQWIYCCPSNYAIWDGNNRLSSRYWVLIILLFYGRRLDSVVEAKIPTPDVSLQSSKNQYIYYVFYIYSYAFIIMTSRHLNCNSFSLFISHKLCLNIY